MKHPKKKNLCAKCGSKLPVFFLPGQRGVPHKDSGHDLCPRCYRSLRSSVHAAQLKPKADPPEGDE